MNKSIILGAALFCAAFVPNLIVRGHAADAKAPDAEELCVMVKMFASEEIFKVCQHAVELHGGNGCFGPGFRANVAIGRAIRLMLLNLGGGISGLASATIFSSPMRYTACITENMELTPWETLAVSRGYKPEEDVITVAMVECPRLHFDDVSTEPERLLIETQDYIARIEAVGRELRKLMSWVKTADSDYQEGSAAR